LAAGAHAAPLLIGLELEAAHERAAASGWEVGEVVRTASVSRPPTGPPRVIKQKVIGARVLALVVAPSIELTRRG